MKDNDKNTLISNAFVVFLVTMCFVISNVYAIEKVDAKQEYKNMNKNFDMKKMQSQTSDTKIIYQNLGLSQQSFSGVDRYHVSNKAIGDNNYFTNKISGPTRIILDLQGIKSSTGKILSVDSSFVSKIRVGVHGSTTRLVFDVKDNNQGMFDVKRTSDGLDIFIFNDKESLALLDSKSYDTKNLIENAKNTTDSNSKKDIHLSLADSIKLLKEENEKKKMDTDSLKQVSFKESSKSDSNSNVQHHVAKILCYERSQKMQVQVGIKDGVDKLSYELNKTSPSEYILKLKNTDVASSINENVSLPKIKNSNIRVVRVDRESNDSKDSSIKFFVNSSAILKAKKTKIGVLISETSISDLKKKEQVASIVREDEAIKAQPKIEKVIENENENKNAEKVEDVKAKPDMKKVADKSKANNIKSQEGVIEMDELATDESEEKEKKRLGEVEAMDEELSKLLDPASGYTGKLISLDFQDTDIDNALKIIAEVSNLNIIASDDITGKVSLKLNNIPWDQALDVILKTNGLDKVQEGNVIRIAPVNTLKNEREALKAARQAEENLEPLQLAYRRISYAKAAELQALVETVLSDRGSVTFDDRSNQIFIKDIKPRIKDAFEIIKKADLRTPQILLETQIIEAQRSLVRELGSEFGFSLIQSQETGNGTGYNFPSDVTVAGSNGETGNTFSSFPAAAGSAVSFIFDSLDGTKSLSAKLSGLEDEGKIKTISKPSVVTTNNTPAEIKNVETINIKLPDGGTTVATGQGSSASGSSKSATESIDVGITLKVTPQASPDYYVLLDVMGESSQFGSRVVDGVPSIVIRRATSTVLVSSGQTFALGGVYKVTDKDSVSGVPFLKDIPVLGHFFRLSKIDNSDEELLFFVTPRIVEGSFDDAE